MRNPQLLDSIRRREILRFLMSNKIRGNHILTAMTLLCPIELYLDKHKFTHISIEMFITPEVISHYRIGPGDEVFMVGRFVNHEGKQRNLPTARFGNISMMTDEPIRHPSGIMQESFVVEARSLSGYSGSPAFVWIPGSDWRTRQLALTLTLGPWLLGVDWGHILDWQKVYEPDKKTRASGDWVVKKNTGMAGIVPAWRLAQLLDSEELKADRQKKDQEAMKKKQESPMALDSNKPEQKSSN